MSDKGKQIACPTNATSVRKMKTMYSSQFGFLCDDCEQDSLARRTRCKKCKLLLCSGCYLIHHSALGCNLP